MTTTDDAAVTAPEAQGRRRARLLPWAVVLAAALTVLALVGGARAVAAWPVVAGPAWQCDAGRTVTDLQAGLVPSDLDGVDQDAVEGRDMLALTEDMSCWGTWQVTNTGPLPLELRRFGFPLGGPGTGAPYRLVAVEVDGDDRPLAGPRASGRGGRAEHVLEVGVADLGWLGSGESVRVAWQVVAGEGCASVGSSMAMAPKLRTGLGPLLVREREHDGDGTDESLAREPWLAAHNVDSEWASCDQ